MNVGAVYTCGESVEMYRLYTEVLGNKVLLFMGTPKYDLPACSTSTSTRTVFRQNYSFHNFDFEKYKVVFGIVRFRRHYVSSGEITSNLSAMLRQEA